MNFLIQNNKTYYFYQVPHLEQSSSIQLVIRLDNCLEFNQRAVIFEEIIKNISDSFFFHCIIYSFHNLVKSIFVKGVDVIVNYKMAVIFKDNIKFFPTNDKLHHMYMNINETLYSRLVENSLSENMAKTFCNILYNICSDISYSVENLETLQHIPPETTNQLLDLAKQYNYLDGNEMLQQLTDEKIKQLIEQIQVCFNISKIKQFQNSNLIINKFYMNCQQQVLSIKHLTKMNKKSDDDDDEILKRVFISKNVDFSKFPHGIPYYNVYSECTVYLCKGTFSEIFCQMLLHKKLIFAIYNCNERYWYKLKQHVSDTITTYYFVVLAELFDEFKAYFLKLLRKKIFARFINLFILEHEKKIRRYADLIQHKHLYLTQRIANELEKKTFNINIDRRQIKDLDYIEIYICIRHETFIKLLAICNCTITFIYTQKFQKQVFYYVKIKFLNIYTRQIYHLFSDENMAREQIQTFDPLYLLWANRPSCQLFYTSDVESINATTHPKHYIQNCILFLYLSIYKQYPIMPNNITDANTFLVFFIRFMKSFVTNEKNIYYIKNVHDGPLKNIVSVRAIESLIDTKIVDKVFNNKCTTVCTLLNCPNYSGLQNLNNNTIV